MSQNTGNIVQHLIDGEPLKASALTLKLLETQPNAGKLWDLLGVAYLQLSNHHEAIGALQRACQLDPGDAEAWDHLGVAHMRIAQYEDARVSFQKATTLAPEREAYWSNAVFNAMHAGWPELAVACSGHAAALPGVSFGTLCLMAKNLSLLGQFEPAIGLYRQALALADVANTARAQAFVDLGHVLGMADRIGEAADAFRAALALAPERADVHSPLLFSLLHDERVTPERCFAEHLAFGESFNATWKAHANDRNRERQLRIGFVSGDLCFHAVAHFIEPVWRAMDRSRFELWVYAVNPNEDAVTHRLRSLVPNWRMVAGVGDAELAAVIRADGIDILIDLSGHTMMNRMLTFARKPAPLQASWIGYPGTTGLAAVDYTICDRFNAPPGRYERYYTEKFARLPSASVFQPDEQSPEVGPLPALTKGAITFGSFNRPGKLSDAVIAAWSRVLLCVPESRLLLCPVSDAKLAKSLAERFARHGVSTERLVFQHRLTLPEYLALHNQVDIMLDTWPYAGGTTTNHAIWMGVPVVTLRGPSRAHCQGAAVMGRLELDDWVADDVNEFVRIAVTKAGDLPALATLRADLRARSQRSVWRQEDTVVRGLEAALRHMWREWCTDKEPADFEIALADAKPADVSISVPIPVLKPDLPIARDLLPWLELIDASGQYTNFGPMVRRFESALADSFAIAGMPCNAVTTSSGTAALELGLAAHDLPRGSRVLLPSFTFAAAAGIVLRMGLEPVFADVDVLTWQLTPNIARTAAQRVPLALVLPASAFGCTVDVDGWDRFVADTGIPVLIDAAAAYGNQQIGQAAAVVFSFHATKPFGIGEGGMLVTRDGTLSARIRRLSNFGFANGVSHAVGTNAKMSEYAAAIGLAQLDRWPARQQRRRVLWDGYSALLSALPGTLMQQGFRHAALPAVAVLRLPLPAEPAGDALKKAGIHTRRWYHPPLHLHPAFADCARVGPMGDTQLMNTEFLATHALGLPWFADMSEAQCERVARTLHTVLTANDEH